MTARIYGVAPELLGMAGSDVTRLVSLSPIFFDISQPADHERAMEEARHSVSDEAMERIAWSAPRPSAWSASAA